MLKLVFVDMDDTFLTPEKTITPLNRKALEEYLQRAQQSVADFADGGDER